VSAVPEAVVHAPRRRPDRDRTPQDSTPGHDAWQWIALAVLLLCWVAEATLCAATGY